MGDEEAVDQQPPAEEEGQGAATGGPDTTAQDTGATDAGDAPPPDSTGDQDSGDGAIDPRSIYGG